MTEFFIDSEELKEEERTALGNAIGEGVVSDMPLLLEVLFVDEERIRELNAGARGVDAVTDVLSFPAMELVPGGPVTAEEHGECIDVWPDENGKSVLTLGSVVICTARAKEQAEEYGHSVAREICYLAVHGALHCLGYDHETAEQKQEMRLREEEIMARLGLKRE